MITRIERSLCAILLLLTFAGCSGHAQVVYDRQNDGLFGPVHSIHVETLMIQGAEKSKHSSVREVTYAGNGNRIEEIQFDSNGSLETRVSYSYGASGRLEEIVTYMKDGSVSLRKSRSESGDGSRVEESIYEAAALRHKTVTLKDKSARPIELRVFAADGSQESKQTIAYAADVNPSEIAVLDSDDQLISRVKFIYREGLLVEQDEFSENGSLVQRTVLTGDEVHGTQNTASYYDATGSLTGKDLYSREFDGHGNWVKQTKSVLDLKTGVWQLVETTQRRITYY